MAKALSSLLVFFLWVATPAIAQEVSPPSAGGVLIIDPDKVFQETFLGQSIQTQLTTAREELLAENQKLDKELTEEEAELASTRRTVSAEEFQILADSFNAKVENIRTIQETKQQDLASRFETDRQRFFNMILPVLGRVIEDRKGAVVLERRQIFLSVDAIDITDEVISQINQISTDRFTNPAPEDSDEPNPELQPDQ